MGHIVLQGHSLIVHEVVMKQNVDSSSVRCTSCDGICDV